VPRRSRSFLYWQPAPKWRLLPWLANPGNPAMSPHTEGKQVSILLIKQWKERKGQGRGNSLREESPHLKLGTTAHGKC